ALGPGKNALVAQDDAAPDLLRGQRARAGLYPRVVQVHEHAVAYLLRKAGDGETVADDVVRDIFAVLPRLALCGAALDYRLAVLAVQGRQLAAREVEDAVPVRAGAQPLFYAL